MSASGVLDFTYQYPFASTVEETDTGAALQLATCGAHHEHPHFFDGRLYEPRVVADMLLVLAEVVRTHFFVNRPALLDPVVTSSEAMLRFEGFSGCCGVYARVDLPADAFDGDIQSRGTTNVDFNSPMRSALSRLRDRENVRLSVGRQGVTLTRDDEAVVEKKVKLPVRWIKGFSEVQAYQPGLELRTEVSAVEARRFIQGLSRGGGAKRIQFVTQMGKSLRLSSREKPGAVPLSGTNRVRVLEPLLTKAKNLRLWSDGTAGTSAWEVEFFTGRFFLMLSPELYRGFSGEGQVLEKLASNRWQDVLTTVKSEVAWESEIDPAALASELGCSTDEIEAALAVLGARGLAGYDVNRGRYFHRELPFELDKVEMLQPRLKNAKKLLDAGQVKVLTEAEGGHDVEVAGTGVHHHVRLRPDGDRCTCPWFSKHQGQRGPCKHVLAARMLVESKVEAQGEEA